jgi:Ca2+-binding RTX toxin-like protein
MASRLRRFKLGVLFVSAAVTAGGLAAGASAATIEVTNGTAVFRAAPGEANVLSMGIRPLDPCSGTSLVSLCVMHSGGPLTVGAGCELLDPNLAACAEEFQDHIHGRPVLAFAGDRDDTVSENSEIREVTLFGGTGDDSLTSGSGNGKSPSLYGEQGDDTLAVGNNGDGNPLMRGGPGDDELCSCENEGGLQYGEGGDDRLLMSSDGVTAGVQAYDGGPGGDTYVVQRRLVALARIAPGPGADVLDASGLRTGDSIDLRVCHGCVEWVTGSPGNDEITGFARQQELVGRDGNDIIRGLGGPDVLAGQGGDDTMRSRDGSVDTVSCGPGADTALADASDTVSADCETVKRSR